MKIFDNLDMRSNQITNGKFESVSILPTSNLFNGRIVYNETDNKCYYYDGTKGKWVYCATSEDLGDISSVLASVVEVS